MNQVKFPALVGESPLAILAAIGTLRLIHDFVDEGARLSWDPVDRAPVLHTKLPSVEEVVEELSEIVAEMPKDVVVPGAPPGFPRQKKGTSGSDPMRPVPGGTARLFSESDPMRPVPGGMARLFSDLTAESSELQADTAANWMTSLVTDLVFREKQKDGMASYYVPGARRQTIGTMLRNPLEKVRSCPGYLYQALVGWRRVEGVTGEDLDHRAIWGSVDDPQGATGKRRGVPGATWLAVMSFPLWTTTADGKQRCTSGWHSEPIGPDSRRSIPELRLPLWTEPLGPAGVKALVEHPVFEGRWEELNRITLRLLGVFHVCRARRRKVTERDSDEGVLVPLS